MRKAKQPVSRWATAAELINHLGGISADRIYLRPPPGQATEQDVIAMRATIERRLCELIDGVLVEIAYGFRESVIGASLTSEFVGYSESTDRGITLGAGMAYRLRPGCVRRPSVSFVLWERFPGRKLPKEEIPDLAPDLAIQILRPGNTEREMGRALQDYFAAGTQRVWLIDARAESAATYSSPTRRRRIDKDQSLTGGDLLPGFKMPLKQLFARLRR
jgi:Uma2 family endonuclease